MPSAAQAMALAKEKGFIDKVGIHLNLTSGIPLTQQILHDPVMCDPRTGFTADFARDMKTRFYLPKKTRDNVEAEIRAQFEEYRKLGGTLWHVDSHHHVHTDPSIWRVLKKVMKDYPVTSVRIGRNMYTGGNPLMHIYKALLNASIKKSASGRCDDYFGSAADHAEYMRSHPERLKNARIEIMVHPVFDDDGRLADDREGKLYVM